MTKLRQEQVGPVATTDEFSEEDQDRDDDDLRAPVCVALLSLRARFDVHEMAEEGWKNAEAIQSENSDMSGVVSLARPGEQAIEFTFRQGVVTQIAGLKNAKVTSSLDAFMSSLRTSARRTDTSREP